MNKELETIIENEFDCLINDLGCLMGDEWKSESIKKVVNQAFVLGSVSHRRELLKSFAEEAQEKMYEQPDTDLSDFIEDFLKDFNCG